MKKMLILAGLGIVATALLAQSKITPMNIKTGLWESTNTVTISGALGIPPDMAAKLTPEQRARVEAAMSQSALAKPQTTTHKGCLKQEDLTKDPFANKNMENMKCHENLLRSTGSDAEVDVSCEGPDGAFKYHMMLHATDQQHVTGTGHGTASMGGRTMTSDVKFESKWIQATCPANAE